MARKKQLLERLIVEAMEVGSKWEPPVDFFELSELTPPLFHIQIRVRLFQHVRCYCVICYILIVIILWLVTHIIASKICAQFVS